MIVVLLAIQPFKGQIRDQEFLSWFIELMPCEIDNFYFFPACPYAPAL